MEHTLNPPPDASPLMKRGIALMNEGTEASLTEAVALFDQALAMRRATPVRGDHWAAYLTAASWMNRADALTRLGRPGMLAEAVRSYDEAVAVMREVPLEENPLYRRRLAIAWMNRGITLHQQGTPESFARALESFERGIDVVREHPEHALLLAGAWLNRGNAYLRMEPVGAAEAVASANAALSAVESVEKEDLLAAETGLKARYILCQAVAELLAAAAAPEDTLELKSAATDAVEGGMHLARHWEARGEKGFRPFLVDFFRYGVAAYRAHQPQFLSEFILENLDPARPHASFSEDAEMHTLAVEALRAVARDLQTDGFAEVRTPRFDRLLETLRVLQIVAGRLEGLGGERSEPV